MSKEQKIPLPWNPNEGCRLDKKSVPTRGNLAEEQDGSIFHRICPGLDISIPRRKDNFIECIEIEDVPKAKLLSENYAIVSFPGLPEVEIPKRLMAHLLSCCLKDRTAGFSFEVAEELNSNDKKAQLWDNGVLVTKEPITTTVSIQLGTTGYLIIGLKLQPKLCFCDEDCGDEDYIHLIVNLDAVYHDEDDDKIIQDPDLKITDEQLTKLISEHGGGGGGGNPICAQKFFGKYIGDDLFIPFDSVSVDIDQAITATPAPYLSDYEFTVGGIYKVEYFCEHNGWFVTDGQCPSKAPTYAFPTYMVKEYEGLPNMWVTGTLFFYDPTNTSIQPYNTISITWDSDYQGGGYLTPQQAFSNIEFFELQEGRVDRRGFKFKINEGVDGKVVYTAILSRDGSCNTVKTYKVIFKVKDNSAEETVEEA